MDSVEIAVENVISAESVENSLHVHDSIQQDSVSIDMPPDDNPTPENVNQVATTSVLSVGSSSNSESSSKSNLESVTINIEEAAILALGGLQNHALELERSSLMRSSSLATRVESLRKARSIGESYVAHRSNELEETQAIYRSRSVPLSSSDGAIRDNQIRVLRVVPRGGTPQTYTTLSNSPSIHKGDEHQDDITEEEAVCRICFEDLGEERESFKLECKCKGDLSLVHRECSQIWFDLKGNRTCEICNTEVQNITVMVTRRPAADPNGSQNVQVYQPQVQQPPAIVQTPPVQQPQPVVDANKLVKEISILVVVSTIGYFIAIKFFEMGRRGSNPIRDIYDIPASCILGLLTTLAASSFAQEPLMWIYALVQYIIFLFCSQYLYNLLHLDTFQTIIYSAALGIVISRALLPAYRIFKKLNKAWENLLSISSQDGTPPTEAPRTM